MGKKTIAILWSGGADSTYLIQRCLADEQYEMVLAGYVVVANNPQKSESELDAIGRMLPLLSQDSRFIWLGALAEIRLAKSNPNLAYKQMPLWLLALVAAIHPPVDEVAIGYIRGHGNDASAHLEDLKTIYAAYRPLMHRELPSLVFPIAEIPKSQVLAELRPELRAACVYCEAPIKVEGAFRPCGRCRLCAQRAEDEAR